MHFYQALYLRISNLQVRFISGPIVAITVIAVVAMTFYPMIDWENTKFQASADAAKQASRALHSLSSQSLEGSQIVNVSLTPFAFVRVIVEVVKVSDVRSSPPAPAFFDGVLWFIPRDSSFVVRWDTLILITSFLIVAFVAGRTLRKQLPRAITVPKISKSGPQLSSSAEMYLVKDVERALERSEELFSRSTLLLVGGVVMAFVGVAVFFVSLADASATGSINIVAAAGSVVTTSAQSSEVGIFGIPGRQFFQAFKSTAMLIFIEAIAWFLLRQYRALIEDYKSFYRYYMRRANYLASLKLVTEASDASLRARLVEALLGEDLSGRLRQGETTEVLEGQRVIDGNFAETVVTKATEIAHRGVAGKSNRGRVTG